MTQRDGRIAGHRVPAGPGAPLERLRDDLRHQRERGGKAGDKAELGQRNGTGLAVKLGIGNQLSWCRAARKGRHQGRSPLLENVAL